MVLALTLVPHRSQWTLVAIMEVLHQHQIRSQYLQLLLQGLHWLFIHGGKGLTGSHSHSGNYESDHLSICHNGHKGRMWRSQSHQIWPKQEHLFCQIMVTIIELIKLKSWKIMIKRFVWLGGLTRVIASKTRLIRSPRNWRKKPFPTQSKARQRDFGQY